MRVGRPHLQKKKKKKKKKKREKLKISLLASQLPVHFGAAKTTAVPKRRSHAKEAEEEEEAEQQSTCSCLIVRGLDFVSSCLSAHQPQKKDHFLLLLCSLLSALSQQAAPMPPQVYQSRAEQRVKIR